MPLADHHLARITPVDPEHTSRVLSPGSMLSNFLITQSLGFLYGVSCCVLPMIVGQQVSSRLVTGFEAQLAVIALVTLTGASGGLIGLYLFGFPVLLIDGRLSQKFLRRLRNRGGMPSDTRPRVVEWVPRERWKKTLCLDTAIDLMVLRVDQRGVWMKGDRYCYELPAESILAAECESFRPPGCSFQIYMVTIFARSEEGPLELPISYRDYSWSTILNSRRRQQALELVHQINTIAKGQHDQSLPPPTVHEVKRLSAEQSWTNPYASPVLINE